MRKLILLFLVFVFISCNKDEKVDNIVVYHPKPIVKVQVNSINMLRSLVPQLANDVSPSGQTENIRVSHDFFRKRYIWPEDMDGYQMKANLRIVIDTNSFYTDGYLFEYTDEEKKKINNYPSLSGEQRENRMYEDYLKKQEALKSRQICSHSVKIYNEGNSEIVFYGNQIIQEALDVDGIWKPIEFLYFPSVCGTPYVGTEIPILRPGHFFLTAIVKYHGKFKTKVRVKFARGYQLFYSNEITAYINRSQFNLNAIDDFLLDLDECANEYMYQMNMEGAFLEYEKYANNPKYIIQE